MNSKIKKLENKKVQLSYYGMRKELERLGINKEQYEWVKHHIHHICVCPSEFLKHFVIKCIICKILYDNNQRFLTEWSINGRYVDIFCIDNFIAYEIETTLNKSFSKNLAERMKKYIEEHQVIWGVNSHHYDEVKSFTEKNIFVIYTKEIPDNLDEMYNKLKEVIEKTLPNSN